MNIKKQSAEDYIKNFSEKDRLGTLLGCKFIFISEEECIYEYEPNENHFNPNGILHGGALFSVMDSCQGALIHFSLSPEYKFAATGTATIRFNAPAKKERLKIRSWRQKVEGRKIFIGTTAIDSSGNEIAKLEEIWIAISK